MANALYRWPGASGIWVVNSIAVTLLVGLFRYKDLQLV